MTKTFGKVGVVAMALFFAVGTAGAVIVDLNTAGASGTINGAIFQQISPQATGTGLINSFVEISGAGGLDVTSGYNTTVNNVLNNGSSDNFNHAIYVGQVPIVDIGGTLYRQFLLDINESSGGGHEHISLDEIQLFIGGTPNSSVDTFTGGILDHDGTLVYRMDAGGDNWVAMDFQLNSGSGSGDMWFYVPDALFAGFSDNDTVVLYSQFGLQGVNPVGVDAGKYQVSDGFEEWALVLPEGTVIPEPTTLSLLGLGLAGLFARRAMKKA